MITQIFREKSSQPIMLIKSLVAGLVAVVGGALLSVIALNIRARLYPSAGGYALRLFSPAILAFLLLLFLAGSIFEFYRLRMHMH
jgi:hypothetical protein